MDKLNELYKRLKEHFITYVNLANKLGVTTMAVTQWFQRKSIPSEHAIEIENLTNGKIKAIDIIQIFHQAKKEDSK